jgi:hypothetical protein
MRPEGLAALLVWALRAQRCHAHAASQQQQQQPGLGQQGVPLGLRAGGSLQRRAGQQQQQQPGRPRPDTGAAGAGQGLLPAGWLDALQQQLRAKVAGRAAAAAAAGGAGGAVGSSRGVLYSRQGLEVWLQQQLGVQVT